MTLQRWAVGVLVAPRPQETLIRTMESLVDGGWDRAFLFVEPGGKLPLLDESYWTAWEWGQRLGPVRHWLSSLAILCDRRPEAEAYLLVQHDAVLVPGLRKYLEATLFPPGRAGICWPLGCVDRDRRKGAAVRAGWHRADGERFSLGRPACVLSPAAAAEIAREFAAPPDRGAAPFEAEVTRVLKREGLHAWDHTPSLVARQGTALPDKPFPKRDRPAA